MISTMTYTNMNYVDLVAVHVVANPMLSMVAILILLTARQMKVKPN